MLRTFVNSEPQKNLLAQNSPEREADHDQIFHDTEALHQAFLEKISDPEWFQKKLEWLAVIEEKRDTEVDHSNYSHLIGATPIYLNVSPRNYELRDKRLDYSPFFNLAFLLATPEERAQRFDLDLIANYLYSPGNSAQEQMKENFLAFDKKIRSEPRYALEAPKITEEDVESFSPAFHHFLEYLGLEKYWLSTDNPEYWRKIWYFFEVEQQNLHKILYTLFVMDEVYADLGREVPEWQSMMPEVIEHLHIWLGRKSHRLTQFDANSHLSGSLHNVVLSNEEQISSAEDFNFDYSIALHEFTHAMVDQQLFGQPFYFEPSVQPPWLGGVIQEGIAIAIEQYMNAVHGTEFLPPGNKSRIQIMRDIHKVLVGMKIQGISYESIRPTKALHYSEGTKLGIRLRNRGWTIQDVPRLIEEIRKVASEVIGSDDPEALYVVQVEEEKNSVYQKIITRIAELQP